MEFLTLERLEDDMTDFEVLHSEVYKKTYLEISAFFQEQDTLMEKHLILFAQIIYGSMPTMVNIDLECKKGLLNILSEVRDGKIIDFDEIGIVKNYINNSLVGTSKILHFLNPVNYAIWDSRIHRYVTRRKTSYGIGDIGTYMSYLEKVRRIAEEKEYDLLHQKIAKHFEYEIQPSRVMEIIMFQTDKLAKE